MGRPGYVVAMVAAALVITACGADDEEPPATTDETVEVVSAYPAGSADETAVEALVEEAGPELDADPQIVNQPGAAGLSEVASADGDGSTVGVAPLTELTLRTQLSDVGYRGIEDFAPVAVTSTQPMVLAVEKDSPYDALRDFVAISREMTTKVASTGHETAAGIDTSLFAKESGADLVQKRVDHEQQALRSLVSGKTDAAVTSAAAALPFERSGDVRVLGVFAAKPVGAFADAPTMRSRGYDIAFGVDNIVVAPKATSGDDLDTLRRAFTAAAKSESYRKVLADNGYAAKLLTGEALTTYAEKQYAQYQKAIEKLGLAQN